MKRQSFFIQLAELLAERAEKVVEQEQAEYNRAKINLELFKSSGAGEPAIKRAFKRVQNLECGRYLGGPANELLISPKVLKKNSNYLLKTLPPDLDSPDFEKSMSIYEKVKNSSNFNYVTSLSPDELNSWKVQNPGAFEPRSANGELIQSSIIQKYSQVVYGATCLIFLILSGALTVCRRRFLKSNAGIKK